MQIPQAYCALRSAVVRVVVVRVVEVDADPVDLAAVMDDVLEDFDVVGLVVLDVLVVVVTTLEVVVAVFEEVPPTKFADDFDVPVVVIAFVVEGACDVVVAFVVEVTFVVEAFVVLEEVVAAARMRRAAPVTVTMSGPTCCRHKLWATGTLANGARAL